MSNTKTLVRLTADAIESICDEMTEDAYAGFVTLWRTIEPAWDELEVVIPGAYAIAGSATTRFIDAMAEGIDPQPGQSGKNAALLLWLNKGPATDEKLD